MWSQLEIVLLTQADCLCNGGPPTQVLDLVIDSDSGPFQYYWSGPDSYQSFGRSPGNISVPGEYIVTVTNSMNCEFIRSINIESCSDNIKLESLEDAIEHPSACNSADGSIYFRFGGPAGGSGPYTMTLYGQDGNEVPQGTYGWSDLAAGFYSISVVDANGCTADFDVELVPQYGFSIAGNTTVSPCPGENNGAIEILVVGSSEYTITWPDDSHESELKNIGAGTYCVTVSDDNDICDDVVECYTLDEMDLEPLVVASHAVVDACPGGKNGYVSISVFGGRKPYTYQWSIDDTPFLNSEGNPITGAYVGPVSAGQYCVTITDHCGSTLAECYSVGETLPISISGTVISDACPSTGEFGMFEAPKGGIDIEITGGTGNYNIQWSHDNNYTGKKPRGLDPGTYCVTVTNAYAACGTASDCFVVQERISPTIEVIDLQHCEAGDCSQAFIDIAVTNGEGPFSFDWFAYADGGIYFTADTEDISNLPGVGQYCVKVRSPNECPIQKCIDIQNCEDVPSPNITNIITIPVSPAFLEGAIGVDISPADAEFQYSWEGPDGFTSTEQELIPADGPGEYTLTINNGCGDEVSRTITIEECTLDLTFIPISNDCSAQSLAPFTIEVANTTEEDEFFFLNPATNSFVYHPFERFDEETSITTLDFRTGIVENHPFAIINQDGCGGIVNITIAPSEVDAETFDYIHFGNDYVNQTYIPQYCRRATECNGLVAAGPTTLSEVVITAFTDGDGACAFNISCGETILAGNIPGSITTTSGITDDGLNCEEGEFCVGTVNMDATNYFRYLSLLDDDPTSTSTSQVELEVTLKEPLITTITGPVEESVEINEYGECERVRKCKGQVVERTGFGSPTSRLELRSNGTELGVCYEVTYCGDVEISATPTSISPGLCGGIAALVSNEGEFGSVFDALSERIKNSNSIGDIYPVAPIQDYSAKNNVLLTEVRKTAQESLGSYIFPNPTDGICTIILDKEHEYDAPNYHIKVSNLLGEIVYSKAVQQHEYSLDITNFQNGYYILIVNDQNSSTRTHHLIIKQ